MKMNYKLKVILNLILLLMKTYCNVFEFEFVIYK